MSLFYTQSFIYLSACIILNSCSLHAFLCPASFCTSQPGFLPLSVKSLFSPFVSKQCPRSQINLSYVSKILPAVIPSVWDTTKHSKRAPMNYSFISHERLSLCLSCFTLAGKIHWSLPFLWQQEQTTNITWAVHFAMLRQIDLRENASAIGCRFIYSTYVHNANTQIAHT